jgi:hypothetical protein
VILWLIRRFIDRRGPGHDPDPRLLAFARGLAIGALFGAAIAGSSIWRRAHRPR